MECKNHGAGDGWPFSVSASTRHSKGLSKGKGEGRRREREAWRGCFRGRLCLMAWITHRRSADSPRLDFTSPFDASSVHPSGCLQSPPMPRILTSLGDDLNNHYMRGRTSEMKPCRLGSWRSLFLPGDPRNALEVCEKTPRCEDGQETRGITA